MVALIGGILVVLSAYSLSWAFTMEALIWGIVGVLMCIPGVVHFVVVEHLYGKKGKRSSK